MVVYYAFHILHTAVADLDRPSIEYPAQWVVNWKMLIGLDLKIAFPHWS